MLKTARSRPDPRSVAAIAARLRALRRSTAASQVEFCKLTGIAENTWNQYERGRGQPNLQKAIMVVDAVGVTLDWIYLGNGAHLPHQLAIQLREQLDLESSETSASAAPSGRGRLPRGKGEVD